jgi:hypothetical protein
MQAALKLWLVTCCIVGCKLVEAGHVLNWVKLPTLWPQQVLIGCLYELEACVLPESALRVFRCWWWLRSHCRVRLPILTASLVRTRRFKVVKCLAPVLTLGM